MLQVSRAALAPAAATVSQQRAFRRRLLLLCSYKVAVDYVTEFSKRKIFVLGMEVAISTWKGTSLEVVQVRDERFVSGKVSFHARLMKARSNLSRVGPSTSTSSTRTTLEQVVPTLLPLCCSSCGKHL